MEPNSRRAGNFQTIGFMAIVMSASLAAYSQQQPPTVSHPTASSAQVTPRTTNSPYGSAMNTQTGMKVAAGEITGFVYWQMSVLQPQADCQGLTVKVTTVTKSNMPLQLLATTSTLTTMGPVTDYSALDTPKYMLCSYSFHNMPQNIYLRALLYGPPSASVVTPSAFQIPGGNCTSTPPSTLSFMLTGGEMLCGNSAFNINFKLTPVGMARPAVTTAPLLNGSGKPTRMLSSSGATSNLDTSAAPPNSNGGATLLPGQTNVAGIPSSGTRGGLLSSAKPGSDANATGAIGGAGGYIGPTKPVEKNPGPGGFTGGIKAGNSAAISADSGSLMPGASVPSPGFVPRMPPVTSNAKRDASQAANAAEKLKIRSQVKSQLLATRQRTGGSGKGVSAGSHADVPEIRALQQQMTFVSSLRTQGALTNKALLVSQNPNQVRIQPPGSSNPMLHAPPPSKICPAPQIHAVNGKTSGVVFTQDPKYNDYIITGCGFGTQEGQVYLSGAISTGRINMAVKTGMWSDTQIEVMFLSGLTGVLDGWPDLIVTPVGSSAIKFPNSRFYAQRESVPLPFIPQQYVTLANVTVVDAQQQDGTKYCPGPDLSHLFPCIAFNAGPPLDGITNGHDERNVPSQQVSNAVDRNGDRNEFSPGQDVYDLSSMAPGFEIDYSTVFWYAWTSDVCEGWASDATPKKIGDSVGYDTEGHYNWYEKTKTKIVVNWGVDHCAWRWLGMFRVDDWYNSGYSLQVHVVGPIGIDPWTGHPIPKIPNYGHAQPTKLTSIK
jgi:hypothetical protein